MALPNKSDASQIALAVSAGFDRVSGPDVGINFATFQCTGEQLLAFARSCEQVGASVAVMLRDMPPHERGGSPGAKYAR